MKKTNCRKDNKLLVCEQVNQLCLYCHHRKPHEETLTCSVKKLCLAADKRCACVEVTDEEER
jgi:hypothetical protein